MYVPRPIAPEAAIAGRTLTIVTSSGSNGHDYNCNSLKSFRAFPNSRFLQYPSIIAFQEYKFFCGITSNNALAATVCPSME
uniref:Uncharacterized protein n=1 Tax=Arundo donax TaxID=35708 RepID=A0A0A8Z195_ARUDO